ncbi:MAG TPA: type II toxin-antitoxin system HicA family toxin [Tepidisphaeraceae bacterium]|nr:type II toxin-antitoxin system HicA family toxin [Tepidisphaeraceae bacterium]
MEPVGPGAPDVHAGALAHRVESLEDGNAAGVVGGCVHGVFVAECRPLCCVVVSSRQVIQRLEREGWCHVRARGSHHQYVHPNKPGRRVTVPHPKKDLPAGTLRSIMKQAGWDSI